MRERSIVSGACDPMPATGMETAVCNAQVACPEAPKMRIAQGEAKRPLGDAGARAIVTDNTAIYTGAGALKKLNSSDISAPSQEYAFENEVITALAVELSDSGHVYAAVKPKQNGGTKVRVHKLSKDLASVTKVGEVGEVWQQDNALSVDYGEIIAMEQDAAHLYLSFASLHDMLVIKVRKSDMTEHSRYAVANAGQAGGLALGGGALFCGTWKGYLFKIDPVAGTKNLVASPREPIVQVVVYHDPAHATITVFARDRKSVV